MDIVWWLILIVACATNIKALEMNCRAENTQDLTMGLPGRTGKSGPAGPKGEPGDSCDESTLTSRIDELEKSLASSKREIERLHDWQKRYENEVKRLTDIVSNLSEKENHVVFTATPQITEPNMDDAVLNPTGCSDVSTADAIETTSFGGIYKIYPPGFNNGIVVLCDTVTDGGGWIIFQRRLNGSISFERTWDEYSNGFGSVESGYWLGLESLRKLTAHGNWLLRIDMTDWSGEYKYAEYRNFRILSNGYRLKIGKYNGTAHDGMTLHHGFKFTTKDMDNDPWDDGNCADFHKGGWWFHNCATVNLNGVYMPGGIYENALPIGIIWKPWHGYRYSLKSTEMKIRKLN